jgi:hypothetical protein
MKRPDEMTDAEIDERHDQIMAAYKKADAEYPGDEREVWDAVLAAFPGLEEQDLYGHLLIDWIEEQYAARTRH